MKETGKPLRIAFIHHPFSAAFALLESMPFGLNIVQALDQAGHQVDLFIWETDTTIYEQRFSENVRVRKLLSGQPQRVIKRKMDWLNYLNQPFVHLDCFRNRHYDCVFGLGQIGVWLASVMAKHSDAPYVYMNDEFPGSYGLPHDSYWNRMERQAAAGASLIIVPDEQRTQPLYRELGIELSSVEHAVVPNAVLIEQEPEKIDWSARLQLPAESVPLLHAGSIADWAQLPEILGSIPYWPEQTVLILNSRTPVPASYRQELAHLLPRDRVYWTEEPLRETELNSLVSYSMANFALYRDLGDNIRYIGWSAGKLLRSIICGRPVIASRYPSLAFIEEHRLGKLVNHPAEIPAAVDDIVNNQQTYRQNCLEYASTELEFNRWWLQVVERLQKVTGVVLE